MTANDVREKGTGGIFDIRFVMAPWPAFDRNPGGILRIETAFYVAGTGYGKIRNQPLNELDRAYYLAVIGLGHASGQAVP